LSGVESRVFARAPEVVSEIGKLLYPYLSLCTLSHSSYIFCSCFVLSLDACIVTITWSLLFVGALWVICLTRYITLAPRSLSGLSTLVRFLVFYRLIGKHLALLTHMVSGFKSFSEAPCLACKCGTRRSDSPVRALSCRGRGEPAKPGLLYPPVSIACCDTISEKPGLRRRVGSIASELESWVTCCDR
jgi:hypothetical protein